MIMKPLCRALPERDMAKSFTLSWYIPACFSLRFIAAYALKTEVPPGLLLLPDHLCWWALEDHSYGCAPTASTGYLKLDSFLTGRRSINIRQSQKTVDQGPFVCLTGSACSVSQWH
jgi:hypothetical protein